MHMTPLAPPRSNPRGRSKSRTRSTSAAAAAPSVTNPPPPPPPPPLPFDPIIARVYGPTVNIYKDIFQVSSDANQEVLNESYNRVWKEEQLKLDRVADDVALRKSIRLQIDATFAAYQILMNTEKRKKYDKAIGLVVEQPTFVTMTNQKREEYVKDLLFEDDDDDDVKPSVAGKIEYVQPSLSITDFSTPMMQRKLPVVSPEFKVPPAEVHELVQRFSLDEAFIIDGQADSPTAASIFDKSRIADSSPTEVSEFDVFRVANNVVDDDASYTSLHKSGRKKKSQRSRKSRKEKSSSASRDFDTESDEDSFVQEESNIDACVDILQDSFAHEESNLGACVDVFGAMYLDGFPCVQSAHDDDEEESVLYG